jgi:hypothetical protein
MIPLGCAEPIGRQLDTARTSADVSRITKTRPTCHPTDTSANECTWRRRATTTPNGCRGYAQCQQELATHQDAPSTWDLVVVCQVDARNRVSDCRSTGR